MKLIERIKAIRSFNKVINKINKREYSEDVSSELLAALDKLEKEKIITDDFLKDIKVLVYILDNCNAVKSGEHVHLGYTDMIGKNLYTKANDIVDELSANNFIHYRGGGFGVIATFQLTHKDNLLRYLSKKVQVKSERIKFIKKEGTFFKILNFTLERIDKIILAIIIFLATGAAGIVVLNLF